MTIPRQKLATSTWDLDRALRDGSVVVDRWKEPDPEHPSESRQRWVYLLNEPLPHSTPTRTKTMSEQTPFTTPSTETSPFGARQVATTGAKLATQMVGVERVNQIAVDIIKKALGAAGLQRDVLESAAGGRLLRLLAPMAVAQFAGSLPGVTPSNRPAIQTACNLAFACEVQKLVGPVLDQLGALTQSFTEAATGVSASGAEATE